MVDLERHFVDVSKKKAQEKDVMSTSGRISTMAGGLVTRIATNL